MNHMNIHKEFSKCPTCPGDEFCLWSSKVGLRSSGEFPDDSKKNQF